MLDKGTRIGGYEVGEFIEAGGMAEVYLATEVETGELRALKRLTVFDPQFRERIRREGAVLMTLRHRNLVRVVELLYDDNTPILVMEYIHGPDLADWIYSNRPPLVERERVFRQILSAMALAHRAGVIHRDLHPWNILITKDKHGRPTPKIIDFGFAKLVAHGMTMAGTMIGTPAYMAPEQILDSRNIDKRADVFALGCTLYYMVCEREAFDQESQGEIFEATKDGRYVDPREHMPFLPERFVRAIDMCLKPEPRDRLGGAEAVLMVLDGGRA